ncbi:hypothetical protein DFH27DRAFT_567459 [Peziza echinospora]|nr:hypothetical protein DFH27DRAFT_567459 [Peziza echinospora]
MNPNFREAWSPSAVFSPSAARQQLLEAKDWSYIDHWLSTYFSPNQVPQFERNADTLKALLALAAANEAADEERHHIRRVKEKALEELKARWEASSTQTTPLTLLSDSLPQEGAQSLGSLALLSVALNHPISTSSATSQTTNSTISNLATSLITLSKHEAILEQSSIQLTYLNKSLVQTLSQIQHVLDTTFPLDSTSNRTPISKITPSPDLPSLTSSWEYEIRKLQQKAVEYRSRAEQMEREWEGSRAKEMTIQRIREMERAVVELKEHVVGLEGQVKGFQGLPPEKDVARAEVERVEALVRDLEAKREGLYDRMISG